MLISFHNKTLSIKQPIQELIFFFFCICFILQNNNSACVCADLGDVDQDIGVGYVGHTNQALLDDPLTLHLNIGHRGARTQQQRGRTRARVLLLTQCRYLLRSHSNGLVHIYTNKEQSVRGRALNKCATSVSQLKSHFVPVSL